MPDTSSPAGSRALPDSDAPGAADALFESTLRSLDLVGRGKVRDNYAVGEDRLLIVTTDRLSAFDVVMREPIPGKGRVLNQMALFWFDRLRHLVPNHLTGIDPESVVAPDERAQVRGRSMVVKRLRPILVEAVANAMEEIGQDGRRRRGADQPLRLERLHDRIADPLGLRREPLGLARRVYERRRGGTLG